MAESQVIILTGASRGIGAAAAHLLLSKGHRLVVVSRTRAALEQLQSQYPDRVEVFAADVSDFSYGSKAVELAISRWQKLDAVIVNHGVLDPVKKIADATAEEWRTGFDINVFSAISVITPAIPHLRKSQGRIIFTSSGAATHPYQGWGAYGATKAAMNHIAMTLGAEEPLITSISIRPGVVDTEMQREIRESHPQNMGEEEAKKFASLKKDGNLLRPEQPGHVIAKLAINGPKELSGKFLSWNDESLADFQEE